VMAMTRRSSAPRTGSVDGLLLLMKSLFVAQDTARQAIRRAYHTPGHIALQASKNKPCKATHVLLQYALRREAGETTTRSVFLGSRGVGDSELRQCRRCNECTDALLPRAFGAVSLVIPARAEECVRRQRTSTLRSQRIRLRIDGCQNGLRDLHEHSAR
jgi:hypothetical protein